MYGYVQNMVVEGIGGEVCFPIDFSTYLGTQMVSLTNCNPWEADEVSAKEKTAIDFVIASAKPDQFQASDAFGVFLAPKQGRTLHQSNEDQNTMNDWMAANTSIGIHASELCSRGVTTTVGSESNPEWLPVSDYNEDGRDDRGARH